MHLNAMFTNTARSSSSNVMEITFLSKLWQSFKKLTPVLFTLFCSWVLLVAWNSREQLIWTPEKGVGYSLGIIGGVMMLTLLLYPLRKKTGLLGRKTPVKYWFNLHMVLGALGPVFIILHSNYTLGSINGRIAMFSMLAVAISGIIGRYIYTRVHRGLYGKRSSLKELQARSAHSSEMMALFFELMPDAKYRISRIEKLVLSRPSSLLTPLHWFYSRVMITFFYLRLYWNLSTALRMQEERSSSNEKHRLIKQSLRQHLGQHKSILIKTLEFQFYDRLFSLWHHLHLPLFILLIITGFFHVYAVHTY